VRIEATETMMGIFAAIGQWFVSTKLGRALLALGAVLLAIGIAALAGFEKGKYAEAKANATKRIKDAATAAKAAQETYADAEAAAKQVQADAVAQPPPDPVKRDDLNDTF
jgi:type II secretory pathway pseudopilin PulG